MEPRIQYAKTADGVSIAFWTVGEGMPLVRVPTMPWSHIQMEWQIPEFRRGWERLAETRMLAGYDGRGFGLSERNVAEYSLDALVLDLEAVVDHVGLQRFALSAMGFGGPVAIAYATLHSERVSRLVLSHSFARGSDFWSSSRHRAFTALRETDWETFTEAVAQFVFGWSGAESARRLTALVRECSTPEALQAFMVAARGFDVTALLPKVKSPTLVLQGRGPQSLTMDIARGIASRIPNARLMVLDEMQNFPIVSEAATAAIDDFLSEGEEAAAGAEPPAAGAEPPAAGAFRTVLFTDVEGSTALTQRLGDARAREVLREHERIVREALRAHGGSEVKALGDGFMASFSSATRALECAIATHKAFAEHNESAGEPIRVRIGLNAGEPIAEAADLFGTAVNLAARIAAQAAGGEILVANVVRELAAGKGFLFADRGETALRGFEDPVRLYQVRWGEQG
jgi:class 3 adenylate cyclase